MIDLLRAEQKVYSQNGEDGVIAALLNQISGVANLPRYFVEIGAGDGLECNTANLRAIGWQGVMIDGRANNAGGLVREHYVTAGNVDSLLASYGVPSEFALLSIDIDGNDFWIWKAIGEAAIPRYPAIVVIEYNATISPHDCRTIKYDPEFRWSGTDYYGASLLALERLGRKLGYGLVYCELNGTNAFFVRDKYLHAVGVTVPKRAHEVYRPHPGGNRWPRDPDRKMIDPFLGGRHSAAVRQSAEVKQ